MAAFKYPNVPPISGGDRSGASHLAWLTKLVDAIERAQLVLSLMTGPSMGVTPDDSATWCPPPCFIPSETDLASMSISVGGGIAFCNYVPITSFSRLVSDPFTAPTTGPRCDRVGINAATLALEVMPGTEGDDTETPFPAIEGAQPVFPICWVHHRVGETSIKTTDDSTNGYIVDARPVAS